jgi:hypothetical protein
MCATDDLGQTPAPTGAEQRLFVWGQEQMAAAFPEHVQATANAETTAAISAAVNFGFCRFVQDALMARASAAEFLPAMHSLAFDRSAEDADIGFGAHIEPRSPAALAAATLESTYAPSQFYVAVDALTCKDEQGNPARIVPSLWRDFETLAERGYRPAMAMLGTLILDGCAPPNATYADARVWFERAAAGMEIEQ